jgi:hypothetical protein
MRWSGSSLSAGNLGESPCEVPPQRRHPRLTIGRKESQIWSRRGDSNSRPRVYEPRFFRQRPVFGSVSGGGGCCHRPSLTLSRCAVLILAATAGSLLGGMQSPASTLRRMISRFRAEMAALASFQWTVRGFAMVRPWSRVLSRCVAGVGTLVIGIIAWNQGLVTKIGSMVQELVGVQ